MPEENGLGRDSRTRKVQLKAEYRALSEPVLLEIQQREQDIFDYLSKTPKEISLA
jgi:hypothetical protein